jgi:hypothetical protein
MPRLVSWTLLGRCVPFTVYSTVYVQILAGFAMAVRCFCQDCTKHQPLGYRSTSSPRVSDEECVTGKKSKRLRGILAACSSRRDDCWCPLGSMSSRDDANGSSLPRLKICVGPALAGRHKVIRPSRLRKPNLNMRQVCISNNDARRVECPPKLT